MGANINVTKYRSSSSPLNFNPSLQQTLFHMPQRSPQRSPIQNATNRPTAHANSLAQPAASTCTYMRAAEREKRAPRRSPPPLFPPSPGSAPSQAQLGSHATLTRPPSRAPRATVGVRRAPAAQRVGLQAADVPPQPPRRPFSSARRCILLVQARLPLGAPFPSLRQRSPRSVERHAGGKCASSSSSPSLPPAVCSHVLLAPP